MGEGQQRLHFPLRNQPMLEVFARTSEQIDTAIAAFDDALGDEMARFEALAGE